MGVRLAGGSPSMLKTGLFRLEGMPRRSVFAKAGKRPREPITAYAPYAPLRD